MASPFTLTLDPLNEECLKMAQTELRETPEVVQQAIAELRELLKNDPTIYFPDDDEFLIIFLRPCKFYAESAFKLMKRISDFKKKHKAILTDLLPEDEKQAFTDYQVCNVLKDRDHKGRRVLIVNCGGLWDPSKVSSDQLFRMFYLIHEAAVLEPESQVRGVVVLMDFSGLGRKQIVAFNPSFSMKLLGFIQDAMPLRLKEVHIVKQPFIFNIVWQIFCPFIQEKLKGRIFLHGSDMKSFHKYMAPSHLPKNYGGELPEIDYSGADWYPMAFTLETGDPSPELKAFAEKDIRETPENIKKGLEELKEFLRNDPSLNFSTEDDFLMIFLRPCKFYAKSAYELMKRIAEFKEKNKNLVENLMPQEVQEVVSQHDIVNVLKDRDHKGRRVLIQHGGSRWDPSKVSADVVFKMLYLMHEAAVLEPETQIRGGVVILDFDGLTTKQVMALTPAVSMRLLSFIQEAMPLRLKEVHIVKQPFIFNMVWTIFKPFIKEKLKGRLHFHGTKMSSLHKFLEPSHLPKNYGGDLPEIDYTGANWYPAIDNHLDHMKTMSECGFAKK
ncbi:hypothetical protein FQR65_LT04285 [Abscondita terminalis]|nr:hypothetical protein FQR65_LT04285 [Abscondita terminalis]